MSVKTSYEQARKDVQRLLEQIQSDLAEHDQDFEKPGNEQNWGYVGNLDRVREILQEATDFLQ